MWPMSIVSISYEVFYPKKNLFCRFNNLISIAPICLGPIIQSQRDLWPKTLSVNLLLIRSRALDMHQGGVKSTTKLVGISNHNFITAEQSRKCFRVAVVFCIAVAGRRREYLSINYNVQLNMQAVTETEALEQHLIHGKLN